MNPEIRIWMIKEGTHKGMFTWVLFLNGEIVDSANSPKYSLQDTAHEACNAWVMYPMMQG